MKEEDNMKAEIHCGQGKFKDFEGNSIQELIESNWKEIFDEETRKAIGNAAGYILERVWIEYSGSNTASLHVVGHGNESYLKYDPTNDKSKEKVFILRGISETDLPEPYEFEIKKNEKFDPFKELTNHKDDPIIMLGILEACIDYLAESKKVSEPPTITVNTKYITLKDRNVSLYISQLMKVFGYLNIKRTARNKNVFELLDESNNNLISILEENKVIKPMTYVYYYKTMGYFRAAGKMTALKYYREQCGKSQQEIADAVRISLRQYQRYEAVNSQLDKVNPIIIEKIAESVNTKKDKIVKNGSVVLRDKQ